MLTEAQTQPQELRAGTAIIKLSNKVVKFWFYRRASPTIAPASRNSTNGRSETAVSQARRGGEGGGLIQAETGSPRKVQIGCGLDLGREWVTNPSLLLSGTLTFLAMRATARSPGV
ncbi:uncharacterized protein VTP21DRAFT_2308 [Calcarisporiella thermophila]|uniref:uncharacterized protein n=1 Tax=Calcarisporiella thermophila TaxID=911321 RepID=UPI003742AA1A